MKKILIEIKNEQQAIVTIEGDEEAIKAVWEVLKKSRTIISMMAWKKEWDNKEEK